MKILNIGISPGFLLIKKENDKSNIYESASHYANISHNGDLEYQTTETGCIYPSPSDFDILPYTRLRWYPHFFLRQNDGKGYKRDYLYPPRHFIWCFGASGEHRKKGYNHPW